MKQRIEYIDNIKGFAILLVVMGHVIANWFGDFYVVLDNDTDNQLMIWKLIYSFHMPLFMFCSGLFQPVLNCESTWKDVKGIIIRRLKVLMVPYFCSGFVLGLITGKLQFYWFLLILFEFIIINLSVSFVLQRISGKMADRVELVIFTSIYGIFYLLFKYCLKYEHLPLLDLGHLSQYPYFVLGYIVKKHNLFGKFQNNTVYTLSLILFSLLFVMSMQPSFPPIPLSGLVKSMAALIVVFNLFKKADGVVSSSIVKALNSMGKHSLEIYILHFFFLTKLPVVGHLISEYAQIGGGRITVVLGIVFSLMMSVINILLCYLVCQVIKPSKFLSQIFLGRKY